MGASLKRNRIDLQPACSSETFNHPYVYPPDDGTLLRTVVTHIMTCDVHVGGDYFTTYFHLGTRKFDATKPDSFLFGDLSDINYLAHVPSAVSMYLVESV